MKTLRDFLDIPLSDLKENIKEYVEFSFQYWEKVLENKPKCDCHCEKTGEETESEKQPEEEKPKLPLDLASLIELNKAFVEKYQSTGAESLLKHLAKQLANDRKCEPDDVVEEIKEAIKVSPEHQEILAIHTADRAEFIINKVLDQYPDLKNDVISGKNKEALTKLDKYVVEASYGTVPGADLKFALRSILSSLVK